MLDETTFRRHANTALDSLKQSLMQAETEAEFEVEEHDGALNISFEDSPSKFVLTPNITMRQIWIATPAASFQLDWDESKQAFLLAKTGETLHALVMRLMMEQIGGDIVLS